jgi:hypothetical protein
MPARVGETNRQSELFARDQPWLSQIFSWEGRVIAQTQHGFHLIDMDADRALPVTSPGGRTTTGMGTYRGAPVVLCRDGANQRLFSRTNRGWEMKAIPGTHAGLDAVLVCSQTHLVLVSPDGLSWRTGEDWVTTPLPDIRPAGVRGRRHFLLDGERLLIGWDAGEWGGGLISVDLRSGEHVSLAPVPGVPVCDMQIDRQNRIWVTQGLAHLSLIQGFLHVQDGQGWTCVASSSNVNGDMKNWDFPPSAFHAVSFTPSGVLHMLGGSVGLVRLIQNRWERMIPDWPEHVYVSCLHMVRDDLALIGLFDGGVLVADLAARTLKRITLGWSYYASTAS